MIYIAAPCNTYEYPHMEVEIALGLAEGFQHFGYSAVVAWDGPSLVHKKVRHVTMSSVRPKPEDLVLVAAPKLATQIAKNPKDYKNLTSGPWKKWMYTSCIHPPDTTKHWGFYEVILCENKDHVPELNGTFPDSKTVWCMNGIQPWIDLSVPSPYPDYGRHLFFAGRLMQSTMTGSMSIPKMLASIVDRLPEYYHLWFLTSRFHVPSVDDGIPGDLSRIAVKHRGKSLIENIGFPNHAVTLNPREHLLVDKDTMLRTVEKVLKHNRIHFVGSKPFGTFWEWHHHAWASLDFGYKHIPLGPNSKITDPLAAGGRVVADGNSFSWYMPKKYDAGSFVPWQDMGTMASAIHDLEPETSEFRIQRAKRVFEGESWRSRVDHIIQETSRTQFSVPKGQVENDDTGSVLRT